MVGIKQQATLALLLALGAAGPGVGAFGATAVQVCVAGDGSDDESLAKLGRVIDTILRNRDGVDFDAQVQRIVKLGEPAIPVVYLIAAGIPRPGNASGPDDDASGSADGHKQAIAALRELPAARVDAFLTDVGTSAKRLDRALPAVTVAGELGRASSIAILQRIVVGLPEELHAHPVLGGTLRGALVAILTIDPAASRSVPSFAMALPTPLAPFVFEAIHDAKPVDRLALLTAMFGRQAAWDVAIVTELDREPPTREEDWTATAAFLAAHVRDPAIETRRAVANALRRYPMIETARALTDLLGDDDERVRELAPRSLVTLTGVSQPADAAEWRDWIEEEERWLANDWPALETHLASAQTDDVLRILSTVARRRVHSSVLAHALLPVLRDPRPELRIAACDALERLGAPIGLAVVRELLEDPDTRVQDAARRLLVRMGALT